MKRLSDCTHLHDMGKASLVLGAHRALKSSFMLTWIANNMLKVVKEYCVWTIGAHGSSQLNMDSMQQEADMNDMDIDFQVPQRESNKRSATDMGMWEARNKRQKIEEVPVVSSVAAG